MNASYIELGFACFMNYYNLVWKGDNYSYGLIINNIYLIFCSLLVLAFPAWLLYFLRKNYEKLEEEEFKGKYENAYKGIDLIANKGATLMPVIYCLRRLLLVFCCCYWVGYPIA